MKGLDTNVLVRFVTRDDPEQADLALRLVEDAEAAGERLFIGSIVLCELVWTLSGGAYRYSRHDVAALLDRLLEVAVFEVEDRDAVRAALDDFRGGRGGFADCLVGRRHRRAGCEVTVTFDRRLAGYELFEPLG